MELKLKLPVPTSINKLYINEYQYQFNPITRKKERMPTGRKILSPEGRKVKAKLQGEARVQLQQQLDNWDYDWTKENFVYQDAVIIFARRGSDDNNIYKLLNDSLEGIVYENDSRVLVRTQKIMYNPKNPYIELTLKPVNFVGVFDSKDDAIEFENRCMHCSRYRNGKCSILKDLLNGTVREEVDLTSYNPKCNEFKDKK